MGDAMYPKVQVLFAVYSMYMGEHLHYIVRRNSSLVTAPAPPDSVSHNSTVFIRICLEWAFLILQLQYYILTHRMHIRILYGSFQY